MEVPGEATRGASSPGTGVNGKCELPREVLETRLGPFASAASDVTAESSFVYLTQTRVTWEEGTSSQEMLPNGWLWGMYVLLIIHVGGASPWAGGLGGVKEQAELAMRSETACSAPPWPLLTEDTRHSLFLALPCLPPPACISSLPLFPLSPTFPPSPLRLARTLCLFSCLHLGPADIVITLMHVGSSPLPPARTHSLTHNVPSRPALYF